jgi:alpha-methylacyl-CoA racemase
MSTPSTGQRGPLAGRRIIELGGIGPVPFCGMLLADMGADVIRIDRAGFVDPIHLQGRFDILRRGKKSILLDLKSAQGRAAVQKLAERSDGLIEGFRPGVAERLGLGPEALMAGNPRLVYGRLTGWGQSGRLSQAAGHDINYLALSGLLGAIGLKDSRPVPPLNLVGDMGGGALFLALAMVSAMLERERSGKGQVIDAAIVDGAALLGSVVFALHAAGMWVESRGENITDSGEPWYDSYRTRDGGYVAIAPIEPAFRQEFIRLAGLDPREIETLDQAPDRTALRRRLTALFAERSRADWEALFEISSACATPVLSLSETARHPHHVERGTFCEIDGVVQPSPSPRFSRTPAAVPRPPAAIGADTEAILAELAALR